MTATTPFFDIESAFQAKLLTVSGAPSAANIDFEGTKTYTPVLGTRFWRTTNNAANSSQVTADAMQLHTGVYQVDIITPVAKGLKSILNDMDAIQYAFNTVTSLNANGTKIIINGVGRTRVTREDSWLYGSVKILYNCYSY
jgi:hypothetical protein